MQTPGEIAQVMEALRSELNALRRPAERHLMRESTDCLGRLAQVVWTVDAVFDDAPDGQLSQAQAETAYEAFQAIAGVALAQLALIRLQHPNVAGENGQRRRAEFILNPDGGPYV